MTVYSVLVEDYNDIPDDDVLKVFTDVAKANEYVMDYALHIWDIGDDGWYEDGFSDWKYWPGCAGMDSNCGNLVMTAPNGVWTKVWVSRTEMDRS